MSTHPAPIASVLGREILDSRGNPTVEVDVILTDGTLGRAAVPSGASTGMYEAVELRDGDKRRYLGKGVSKAVANVNAALAKVVVGRDPSDQVGLDMAMIAADGTENKGKLGANAILGVSLAAAKAAAAAHGLPLYRYLGGANARVLPIPMANIINGGKHADNKIDFQEFMVMPLGAKSFSEGIRMVAEVFHHLKSCSRRPGTTRPSATKAASPPTSTTRRRSSSSSKPSTRPATPPAATSDFAIALDCASSELFDEGDKKGYKFWKSNPDKLFSSQEMIELFESWVDKYPIVSIEDPLDQDDWDGYADITQALGGKTSRSSATTSSSPTPSVWPTASRRAAATASSSRSTRSARLTETFDAVEMAQRNDYTAVISHRSGETEDATIADIAVATNAGQIKTGSASRSDRIAKYNQLLRIEEELGASAVYGLK